MIENSREKKKKALRIDWFTIIVVLALVAIGLVSIASIMASPFSGSERTLSDYLEKLNLEFVQRQAQNFLVGVAAMLVMLVFDFHIYKSVINYIYIANISVILLLFAFGVIRGGAQGWFALDSINRAVQPAELSKVTLIVIISKYVSAAMDKDGKLVRFKDIMICVALCALPAGLIIMQNDLGSALVLIVILVIILFVGRISWKWIVSAAAAMLIGSPLLYFYVLSDFQRKRIDVFLNPELDPLKSGYNVIRAKMSIGSGQLYGKGYFTQGTLAQLRFVPERHTDFIFAGIGEGLGFVGGVAIICLYFALAFRWLWTAIKANDSFGTCMVTGAIGMLMAHTFENIGMNIGLMPVTGIPLPFISYGGSNLLTNMMVVGIVLNVHMRRPQKR